jgi:hypothetical protein
MIDIEIENSKRKWCRKRLPEIALMRMSSLGQRWAERASHDVLSSLKRGSIGI